MSDMDWQKDGACAAHPDPELWAATDAPTVAIARRICLRDCWVQQACGEWSMAQPKSLEGVWAGLTRTDRNALRRRAA